MRDLRVNILICDLFFGIIEIDIANYVDDTAPYAPDSKLWINNEGIHLFSVCMLCIGMDVSQYENE